jgi:hypothetical protein
MDAGSQHDGQAGREDLKLAKKAIGTNAVPIEQLADPKKRRTSGLHPSAAYCCASSLVIGTKEFVNVLMFKLLDHLPQAIKDSSQRVRLIIADLVNQGVEVVHKSMVVSKSLRGGQS